MEILVLVLLGIAVGFDIRFYKIPNALIVTTLVTCFVIKGIQDGVPGICKGILTSVATLLVMMVAYRLKAIGAGDAKMLSAIAVYYDMRHIINITLNTLFVAGCLGIIILFISFIRKTLKKRHHFPFSIAIFTAVIMYSLGISVLDYLFY